MTNRINSYTSWQPLEEVIVGRSFPPDYFDFIEDSQVRGQLQQILAETEEEIEDIDVDDLENSRDLLDETELEDSQEN